MKLIWTTDNHWEFCPEYQKLIEQECEYFNYAADIVINVGDIAPYHKLFKVLDLYDKYLKIPMYFTLGNHDFYGGPFIHSLKKQCELKVWEHVAYGPSFDFIRLNKKIIAVFIDGFAGGNYFYRKSLVNDELFIKNFQNKSIIQQSEFRNRLSFDSVDEFSSILKALDALDESYKEIWIFTHYPPFEEACLYKGQPTDKKFIPFFCNFYLGRYINFFATKNKDIKVKVFCGHTHDEFKCTIKPNLEIHVGKGEYGMQCHNEIEIKE